MSAQNVNSNGKRPTVISLFSGCGGSSLGYKMAGYDERLAVEWDDNAAEVFKLNFGEVCIYHGDIKNLSGEECLKLSRLKKGDLDVLDGSPPCQGFSLSGKGDVNDPRNSLFKEYVRLLVWLRPKAIVMENVTGLINARMRSNYLGIMEALRGCGYKVRGEILNSMYFNVPQRRRRVIIIGIRNDLKIQPSHPTPKANPIPVIRALRGIPMEGTKRIGPALFRYWVKCPIGCSFSKVHPRGSFFNWIKVNPNKPAPTIAKCPTMTHWDRPEFLSIAMIKRLFSFPDSFKFVGSFKDQWARIGNSVPPNLMKAIAIHLKNILQKKRET